MVTVKKTVPFAAGFLSEPIDNKEETRLLGTKCNDCSTVLLGSRDCCEACASKNVKITPLSRTGKIWSYTIMRYPPPWVFEIDNPHKPPLPVAWVELPEGVQLVSQIDGDPDQLSIDLDVELVVDKGWTDEDGNDVLMYKFRPVN